MTEITEKESRILALQPSLRLSAWRLVEVINPQGVGSSHLVGWKNTSGRMSTAVAELDLTTLVAWTVSERQYQLEGEHEFSADADYVYGRWLQANHCKNHKVLTGAATCARRVIDLSSYLEP